MIPGVSLIILGLLAVPSLILSRKPNAKELLDKITPFQGWIGLAFALWAIFGIISDSIIGFGDFLRSPMYWASIFVAYILQIILGFILGYGVLSKLILTRNEEAKNKAATILAKLAPWEGTLGILGVVLGIWAIFAKIVFHIRF